MNTPDPELDLAQNTLLDLRFDQVKADLALHTPPDALEEALVARFRRGHNPRPSLWWMPPLALAATVAIVSWMVRAPLPLAQVASVAPAAAERSFSIVAATSADDVKRVWLSAVR